MKFLLFAGASNTLAAGEIDVQIENSKEVQANIYSFEANDPESAIYKISRLGSSIKLAKEVVGVSASTESLSEIISLKDFSVTDLNDFSLTPKLNQTIKNLLKKGRFVLPKDQFGLSPILLKKHRVEEFFLDKAKDEVWQTVWVHDFRHWIEKDRHMPYANARAGILPPKIARSMINLIPFGHEEKFLVDPFCGSGRVLVEAAELGYRIGGADIVSRQIEETGANLKHFNFQAQLEVLDATHLSNKFGEVDVIVTEPYLGKPNPRPDQMKYIVPGLQKLYLGCLKDWLRVLKPGGYVVMVFPWFDDGKKVYKTSSVIDGKLELGYNHLKRGILYSRPDADVKREIVVLQKK